jgi:hypothetical protein
MIGAEEFRRNAEEALEWASQSKDEIEKRDLIELASTWAKAAIASQMIFGSSLSPPPHAADELKSLTPS